MAAELSYNSSPGHTVGVELELQLLDSRSLMFTNIAPNVLGALPETMRLRIKEELLTCMVELNTSICPDVNQVEADLTQSLDTLEAGLDGLDAVFHATSLHPLECGSGDNLTEGERYHRIMDDLQIVGRRFITQGLHVHIGVEEPERAIKINNAIRMYLPILLALSTSSPFYVGENTGMYSYRTKLFEVLPLAGMPDEVDGWQGFQQMVDLLIRGGIIETVRDLWWDVRPNIDLGTVEVRICDVPVRLSDIVAIAAMIQALVATVENVNMHPEASLSQQILRANKWQAARYGLDGVFINPISAVRSTMRQATHELLEIIAPEARRLGSTHRLEGINRILEHGTGAHRHLELFDKLGDHREVIKQMKEEFFER